MSDAVESPVDIQYVGSYNSSLVMDFVSPNIWTIVSSKNIQPYIPIDSPSVSPSVEPSSLPTRTPTVGFIKSNCMMFVFHDMLSTDGVTWNGRLTMRSSGGSEVLQIITRSPQEFRYCPDASSKQGSRLCRIPTGFAE